MLKLSLSLAVALLGLWSPAGAQETKEVDPGLAKIHKLFIKGNNEAATFVRKLLIKGTKNWDKSATARPPCCFEPAGNEKDADGTLELSQEVIRDGAAATVSGTVTGKDGNLIWSDSKRGEPNGLVPLTAAESAALGVLDSLTKESCEPLPTIELGRVRKIYVVEDPQLKKGIWRSDDCLTFVEDSHQADAILLPNLQRDNKLAWQLMDPKSNKWISGWSSDYSAPDIKELRKAVGCR